MDDSGPGRRGGGLGGVGRVGGYCFGSFKWLAGTADSPDPVTAAQQFSDHGGADGTGSAENDVNRAVWCGHHGSPGCGRARGLASEVTTAAARRP